MERSVNNMLIRDEHNNSPLYEVLDTSEILQRNSTFAPGEFVPVNQLGSEIKRLDEKQIPDMSSANTIQLAKAFIEEYKSSSDQLFRNATNEGGGKTLGEIKVGIQQNQGSLTVEVTRWNQVLSKVYTKVFKIMQERLGDSIYVEGNPITRETFNFLAQVKSNGNLEVSNAQFATQKAWLRLQAAISMLQVGVADKEDVYNAYKDWLEKDGIKDPEQFSTHPQEIMQKQLAQLQQALQQAGMQLQQLQKRKEDTVKDLAKLEEKGKKVEKELEGKEEAVMEGMGMYPVKR
jgi:hypothetical protein